MGTIGPLKRYGLTLVRSDLGPHPDAFDHPHFILEPKIDGFRALANRCNKLVSRNGHGVRGLRVTRRHR